MLFCCLCFVLLQLLLNDCCCYSVFDWLQFSNLLFLYRIGRGRRKAKKKRSEEKEKKKAEQKKKVFSSLPLSFRKKWRTKNQFCPFLKLHLIIAPHRYCTKIVRITNRKKNVLKKFEAKKKGWYIWFTIVVVVFFLFPFFFFVSIVVFFRRQIFQFCFFFFFEEKDT